MVRSMEATVGGAGKARTPALAFEFDQNDPNCCQKIFFGNIMDNPLLKGFLAVVVLLAVVLLAGRMGWLSGRAPVDLGNRDGRLKPPSRTPNSVSSQAGLHPDHPQRERAQIAPLSFQGDGHEAMRRLAALLERQPRTRVVVNDPDYLRAESSSATLRFTDDLEFWLDQANNVIQVRSASRIGYGDWGANRQRVEALRAAFATTPRP